MPQSRHANRINNIKKANAIKFASIKAKKDEEKFNKMMGWVSEDQNDANRSFVKKMITELYVKYKQDVIIGGEDEKSTEKFINKFIKKDKKNADKLCITRGYAVYKDKLQNFMNNHMKLCNIKCDFNSIENDTIIQQILFITKMDFLINPPKCNGEENNISCGFIGSIWCDKVIKLINGKTIKIRIAYYKDNAVIGDIDEEKPFNILLMDYFDDIKEKNYE